jgi:hypothetical protein
LYVIIKTNRLFVNNAKFLTFSIILSFVPGLVKNSPAYC